jgi:uncharacterized membrane protein (DUF4010 family)
MDSTRIMGLAVALGLGLLVGMQREWKASGTAGVRTFALFSLLGAVLAQLDGGVAPWAVAAGMIGITSLLVFANVAKLSQSDHDVGLTTEVAALLIYAIGAAAGQGFIAPAVVIGGVTAVLLHWKQPIHSFIDSIGEKDFRGIAQLVLIGLVILPLLPDETYGPYDVLNPYRIWGMVVLIVGISLCAYLAQRALGDRTGSLLGGLLGGLVSSTATTVSYAKRSTNQAGAAWLTALVIMLASAVVNARALLEVGIVAPGLLRYVLLPLLIHMAGMSLLCGITYYLAKEEQVHQSDAKNPAQLKAAMAFGLLYALVLFVVAVVKTHFGDRALYAVAIVSGLTDINAITLSTAQLFSADRLGGGTAWRIIFIAILANLVFKAGAVAVLGSRSVTWRVLLLFGLSLAMGAALLAFWPDWAIELPDLPHGKEPQ